MQIKTAYISIISGFLSLDGIFNRWQVSILGFGLERCGSDHQSFTSLTAQPVVLL